MRFYLKEVSALDDYQLVRLICMISKLQKEFNSLIILNIEAFQEWISTENNLDNRSFFFKELQLTELLEPG